MRAQVAALTWILSSTKPNCPGFTDTEMLRTHINDSAEVLAAVSAMSAFNRLVAPDEIANTLWFCATNPVINGAVIHANLGQIES